MIRQPSGRSTAPAGPIFPATTLSGNTIIADSNNRRIIEVNPARQIVWSYAVGLNWPRDADRLANGNTLINDSKNRRIIEVSPGGAMVWTHSVDAFSYDSDRLASGNTLLSSGARIVEVADTGTEVWSYPPSLTEELWVRNPASGVDLYGHIHRPADFDSDRQYPGIVLAPGGNGTGTSFDESGQAQQFADGGFVVMHFDPDGRGRSTNGGSYTQEDYCGFLHQDGLRAVVRHLLALPETDDRNIGIATFSYGITMAAGALGRYTYDPPVKFLIEWEGPADRSDTERPNGHVPTGFDDLWWYERQPVNFIGRFRGCFLPVQSEVDHVQPDNEHTVLLNNLATHARHGGGGRCIWTRVNSVSGWTANSPNTFYPPGSSPQWLPETVPLDAVIQQYLAELAAMPPVPPPGDLDGDDDVDPDDLDAFRACTTGPNLGPLSAACLESDLDQDGDVDQSDFGVFQGCLSGEDRPADPNCAH